MALAPKEWKSFQHYKERRPPWIKLHRTLLDNADYQRLPVASRALAPMLWLIAAEYDDGAITATAEDIAWRLRMTVAELKSALEPLIEKCFFLADAVASATLADCEHETRLETETQVQEEVESRSPAKPQARADDAFERFKKTFPRRDGANPWLPAEKKFNALVKTGVDPEVMIRAAGKLAREEGARGNVGTKFIPQALTWLNQQRFHDYAATAFDGPQETDWDAICVTYKRLKIWSKHAPGNSPDSSSCLCPPEILAKHGIRSNSETAQ